MHSSVLETSQQYLAGPEIPHALEFKLGRACLAHCFSASSEYLGMQATSTQELVSFIDAFGAGTESQYYHDGIGWRIPELANLSRINNLEVVVQDLHYDREHTNIQAAERRHRVSSDFEKSRLNLLADYGGEDRSKWGEALDATVMTGGVAICSITIPLLSGDGYGGHSVMVTDIDLDGDRVTYFDPDFYNTSRYGSTVPDIDVADPSKLIYTRPLSDHLSVMGGSVAHVFKGVTPAR